MKQVILIHGGDSFNTYDEYLNSLKNWPVKKESFMPKHDWKTSLQEKLGDDFEVSQPRMPNKQNSKYEEWKIWFERMYPFLYDEVILIGHSLGAMFLVRYLAEITLPKKISALHLVAPAHNNTPDIGDFVMPDNLDKISKQAKNIYLYHSKDDPVVPFSELAVYQKALPRAEVIVLENLGHFYQTEFPELIENIINNAK